MNESMAQVSFNPAQRSGNGESRQWVQDRSASERRRRKQTMTGKQWPRKRKDEKKEKVPTHNMKVKSVVDGSMMGNRWKGPPDVNM